MEYVRFEVFLNVLSLVDCARLSFNGIPKNPQTEWTDQVLGCELWNRTLTNQFLER